MDLRGRDLMSSDPASHSNQRQVTLRRILFFAVPVVAAIVWRAVVVDWALVWKDGLFFAPYHVLGAAGFPVAVVLFLLIPVLLCVIMVLLSRSSPRPFLPWLLVGLASLSYANVFLPPRSHSGLHDSSRILSPILIVLSVLSALEIARLKSKNQTATIICLVVVAFGYWIATSVLVAAASASV